MAFLKLVELITGISERIHSPIKLQAVSLKTLLRIKSITVPFNPNLGDLFRGSF